MKKLYQIRIMKGKRTDSLVERLDKYGPEIAEDTWECNLNDDQVEQIRRIYVRIIIATISVLIGIFALLMGFTTFWLSNEKVGMVELVLLFLIPSLLLLGPIQTFVSPAATSHSLSST